MKKKEKMVNIRGKIFEIYMTVTENNELLILKTTKNRVQKSLH